MGNTDANNTNTGTLDAPDAPDAAVETGGGPAAPPTGGAPVDAERIAQEAVAAALQDVGFDSIDALRGFVKTQREAEDAKLSEVERREKAAAEAEAKAEAQMTAAAASIRASKVERALVRAGANPDHISEIARLVTLPDGDVTDEQVDQAVADVKARDVFAPLFTAATPGVPSTVTSATPRNRPTGEPSGYEAGLKLVDARRPRRTA